MNKKNAVNMLIVLFLFIVFYFYLTTAYPAFKNDDSPETIASGYTLGIAHPPGYPLFTLISKLFTYIPVGSIAFRLNIFAALLGLTVLLFSFVVIRKTVLLMFNTDIHSMIGIPALLILAFSYIFWNQAIEAKGGIYLLNLLFLVLLIYLSIELLINYNKKYLYLMSYILGLSLSNHWPSMIILIPVFSYFYFKYKDKINFSCILVHVLFVVLGLSAYLYLPIRAKTENIFLFMAKPDNWHDFWWTVTRSGYEYPKTEIIEMLKGPFFVFIKIFFKNYSFFWPFIFLGIYISFKMQRKLAILNSLICIIVSFIVVMYNRPLKEYLWLIEIFLLPALYVFWIFMVVGLVYVFNQLKNRIYKNIYLFLIILLIIFMTYKNYTYNNACNNYISYDFGENILRTIKKDSFYLAQGD
ncbi:MAG TPA: DUF2723 domain-containing protein, partial [Candidatus Goldiibacteriota bacterium]|nr:DUF2723 domain-containing protein [Candidatus Goldiibacteriota bacterium]